MMVTQVLLFDYPTKQDLWAFYLGVPCRAEGRACCRRSSALPAPSAIISALEPRSLRCQSVHCEGLSPVASSPMPCGCRRSELRRWRRGIDGMVRAAVKRRAAQLNGLRHAGGLEVAGSKSCYPVGFLNKGVCAPRVAKPSALVTCF